VVPGGRREVDDDATGLRLARCARESANEFCEEAVWITKYIRIQQNTPEFRVFQNTLRIHGIHMKYQVDKYVRIHNKY